MSSDRPATERVTGGAKLRLAAPTLHVVEGAHRGVAVRLGEGTLTIGSGSQAQLRLDDRGVSRRHADIEYREGEYVRRDLASTNGTFVNGRAVKEIALAPGDVVAIGVCRMRFEPRLEEALVPPSASGRLGAAYGTSFAMRQVFGVLERVAGSDATVLMTGESGTGKDLLARAIHEANPRAKRPFLVFDFSAVSPELAPSELFGHVEAAFTGASRGRQGLFEAAAGGTLFLDEIGELDPELQPKLLRALEAREVRPVGSNRAVPVNVRVIAATHRNLDEMKARGSFREDLFFRLAVVRVHLPPLRERREDVAGLVRALLAARPEDAPVNVAPEALSLLAAQPWPGNVRELRNVLERSIALSGSRRLEPEGLCLDPRAGAEPAPAEAAGSSLEDVERELIRRTLARTGGAQIEAARLLGIHRETLRRKLRQYGLYRSSS